MLSVDVFASQLSRPNVRVWNLVIFIVFIVRQGSCPWFPVFYPGRGSVSPSFL